MLKTIESNGFSKEAAGRVKRGDKVWITGRSASGKSHLASSLIKEGVRVLRLDTLGKQGEVDGKKRWIVNIPPSEAKTTQAFEGQSDNLSRVAKAIIEGLADKQRLTVFIVLPGVELFREANAAKARDAKPSDPDSWKASWAEKSKWNAAKIMAYNKESVDSTLISLGAAMGELFEDTVTSGLPQLTVSQLFWDWAREHKLVDKLDLIEEDLREVGVDVILVTNNPTVKGTTLQGWSESESKKEGK